MFAAQISGAKKRVVAHYFIWFSVFCLTFFTPISRQGANNSEKSSIYALYSQFFAFSIWGNNLHSVPQKTWRLGPRIHILAESSENWSSRSYGKPWPATFSELGNSPETARVDFPKNRRSRKTGARVRRFPGKSPGNLPEKLGPVPVTFRKKNSREIFPEIYFPVKTGAGTALAPVFRGNPKKDHFSSRKMVKLHRCTLQELLIRQWKINRVAIKGAFLYMRRQIAVFLHLYGRS